MYTVFRIPRFLRVMGLSLSMVGILAGCGSEQTLTGPAPEQRNASANESEVRIVAAVDFQDGSRIEFQEDNGLLTIVGLGKSMENEARTWLSEKPTDAVAFFERISSSKAPAALVEAGRRMAWYKPGPFSAPEAPVEVARVKDLSPLALTTDEFTDRFCVNGGTCLLNRTGSKSLYVQQASMNAALYSVSGDMTLTVLRWDSWAGVYKTRFSQDILTSKVTYYYEWTLLTETYKVNVTRSTGDTWHLSVFS